MVGWQNLKRRMNSYGGNALRFMWGTPRSENRLAVSVCLRQVCEGGNFWTTCCEAKATRAERSVPVRQRSETESVLQVIHRGAK